MSEIKRIPHPSDFVGLSRILQWKYLAHTVEYEFELISYYNAKPYSYAKGGYIDFAAKVLGDYKDPDLEVDELVKLTVPYTALVNALFALPPKMRLPTRRDVMGDDNLYIKMIKLDKRNMQIKIIERRANTQSLKEEAEKLLALSNIWKQHNEE